MGLRFPRRGASGRDPEPADRQARLDPPGGQRPAADAPPTIPDRSCCCPGRPAVKVIMPVTGTRPRPVDLWLCGHHWRVSQQALDAAGAAVLTLSLTSDPAQPDQETTATQGTSAA